MFFINLQKFASTLKYKFFCISIIELFIACHSKNNSQIEFSSLDDKKIPLNAIPIILNNNRILVESYIFDSISATLLLDNGISNLMLDQQYFNINKLSNNIKIEPNVREVLHFPMGDIGSKVSSDEISITIGPKIIKTSFIKVFNFADLFSSRIFDGIFPMHLLGNDSSLCINFEHNYLTLNNEFDATDYIRIPFEYHRKSMAFIINQKFNVYVNGILNQIEGKYIIYFGNPGSITVNKQNIENLMSSTLEVIEEIDLVSKSFNILQTDSSKFDHSKNICFNNLMISIQDFNKDSLINNYSGLIGISLLRNFNIFIDYNAKCIFMKPFRKEVVYNPNNLLITKGIAFMYHNSQDNDSSKDSHHWNVHWIVKGKTAYNLGIEVGDLLLKIDDLNASEFDMFKGDSLINRAKSFTILKKNGSEKLLY